jgi:hypothetical protein
MDYLTWLGTTLTEVFALPTPKTLTLFNLLF